MGWAQLWAILGFFILLGSLLFGAIQGIQVAVVGTGFILIGILAELRKQGMKKQ
jgi:hypothetical protein